MKEKEKDDAYWDRYKASIVEDLETNPRFTSYFEAHQPDSDNSWKRGYALSKTMWTRTADYHERRILDKVHKYEEFASKMIWDIQKKKLLNLQCLWRAEEIQLPVQTCYDFYYWEDHIEVCPFIPPITQEEVDLYVSYLIEAEEVDIDEWDFSEGTQHYEQYKNQLVNSLECDPDDIFDQPYPDWFAYYDDHMGTGELFYLPDIRGKKEEAYIDSAREAEKAANAEKPSTPYVKDPRPHLPAYHSLRDLQDFVKQFEDPSEYRKYEMYREVREDDIEFGDSLEYFMDRIEDETAVFPVKAHSDWREAVKEGFANYRREKVIKAIPNAFAQYLFRLECGITTETKEGGVWETIRDRHAERILIGRRLAGEPEDFNF